MTIKEILNTDYVDLLKLGKSEFRNITRQITDVANKRLKRLTSELEETGDISPALLSRFMKKGTATSMNYRELYFSTSRTDTFNDLQRTASQALEFIRLKTSTIKGLHEYEKKREKVFRGVSEKTRKILNTSESESDEITILGFRVLDRFRQQYGTVSGIDSNRTLEIVSELIATDYKENGSVDIAENYVARATNKIKEEETERYEEVEEDSEYDSEDFFYIVNTRR